MIAYTALLLFFIGIFSSVKVGVKMDKALAGVGFTSLFFVFMNFISSMSENIAHEFSFMWNTTQGQPLKFDIISNGYNYELVLPFFLITVLVIFNNLLFRYEEKRSYYAAVEIFNFIALIILITSSNFVQLLAALFVIDILSYFMIKDVDWCKRYVLINFLADMLLFTVLAIINCRVDSLDIQQIILYRQKGFYNTFVALSGLTAVFLKMGMFVFQIGIMGLKHIRFHRLQNILFLSSATASLVVLLKFNVLWRESQYFNDYFDFMAIASLIWAFCGSFITDNFKAKLIYWQMLFMALFLELLRYNGFIWERSFTEFLLEMYLLTSVLYLAHFYNNRSSKISEIANIRKAYDKKVFTVVVFLTLLIMAMANTLTTMYNRGNRYYIWAFGLMFVLSLGTTIKEIYLSKQNKIGIKQSYTSFKWLYVAELAILIAMLLYGIRIGEISVWGFTGAFLLICLFSPLNKIQRIAFLQEIREKDILGAVYRFLIKSVRRCGRMLWLIIDHLFMEKFVLKFVSLIAVSQLRLFRTVHNSRLWGGTTAVAVLALLLWLSFKNGGLNNG